MSRFQPIEHYAETLTSGYQLLPFRFSLLKDQQYVLTNMVGEYLIAQRGDVDALVRGNLKPSNALYDDLKAKHFITDGDSQSAYDLLALKMRTKLAPLSNFTALHLFVTTLRCDHSCPYCQVSRANDDRQEFDMSEETAIRAIDLAFRSPSPILKFEFQGGESLLNLPIIRFVIEAVKERNLVVSHGVV